MAVSWLLGRGPGPSAGGPGAWAGAALIGVALALIGWCGLWFLRKRTPIEPHHRPKALITEGPYRLSRNPIYLALVLIASGYALRQDTLLALVPVAGLVWVLDRRFARIEEKALLDTFGGAARAYVARTRRWL